MKQLLMLCVLLCVSCSVHADWEEVTPWLEPKSDKKGFNASVVNSGGVWTIKSHTNPVCMYRSNSTCRKGLISYQRNGYDSSKIRRHSFGFTLKEHSTFPEFLIIYQDWVRIHYDDSNGNRPITTIKLKSNNGRIFMQHWENSWQWNWDERDYDTHLVKGHETMRGEIEIQQDREYNVQVLTQDFAGTGRVSLIVDGVMISDASYKTSYSNPTARHAVMTGMYWSRDFNLSHDPTLRIVATFSDIKHEVMRYGD